MKRVYSLLASLFFTQGVAAQEGDPQWLACLDKSTFENSQFGDCFLEATKVCFPNPFDQSLRNRCYDQGRILLSQKIVDFEQRMSVKKSETFMKLLRAGLEYSDRKTENECDYMVAAFARPQGDPSSTPESLRAQCAFSGTAKTYWRMVVHGQAQ